jgi:hypothetical protein
MHFSTPTISVRFKQPRRYRQRHTSRFASHCETLENRQLLSAGQAGLAAGFLRTSEVSTNQNATPPAGSATGVSSASNLASASSLAVEFGTPGGVNTSQVGFLLSQFGTSGLPVAFQPAGVSIPQTPNDDTTTLTNLSVTILNPDTTSSAAAIIDEQVDSDAYLVPSSPALLRDYLGQTTATPVAVHSNTAATMTSKPIIPLSPVRSQPPPSVTIGGPTLAGNTGVSPPGTAASELTEPVRAQPGAGSDQAPAIPDATQSVPQAPQTGPQGGQAPSSSTPSQSAGQGAQEPAPDSGSQSAPQGEGDPSGATAQRRQAPPTPMNESAVDAALELADGRILARSYDGHAVQANNDDGFPVTDTSWSLSALFGAAALTTAGYNLALRGSDVTRARSIPRWSGAERPTKGKPE